jgi:hypothetical protein
MRIWGKLVAVAVAPLLLTGCLWGPGKFTSNLALNKAGTFVLDYKGEIVLQIPDDKGPAAEPWEESFAHCYADGRAEAGSGAVAVALEPPEPSATREESETEDSDETRTCSPAEVAKLKADYEERAAAANAHRREESENMAKVFGLPGADDESNRRFAASLTKYQGWRSATYKGKGVFDVDYHFEGHVGQDYAFPIMPQADFIIPFVTLRRRADGSVMVTAPALTGGSGPFSARAKMLGLPDKGNDGPVSRAEGRFTIVTDGEILTNNSEDGPAAAPGGRAVHWDVGPGSDKVPEMLVRL